MLFYFTTVLWRRRRSNDHSSLTFFFANFFFSGNWVPELIDDNDNNNDAVLSDFAAHSWGGVTEWCWVARWPLVPTRASWRCTPRATTTQTAPCSRRRWGATSSCQSTSTDAGIVLTWTIGTNIRQVSLQSREPSVGVCRVLSVKSHLFLFTIYTAAMKKKKQNHNKTKQQTAHTHRTNISKVTDCNITPQQCMCNTVRLSLRLTNVNARDAHSRPVQRCNINEHRLLRLLLDVLLT